MFQAEGSRFRVWGLGFRSRGLGFRLGCRPKVGLALHPTNPAILGI